MGYRSNVRIMTDLDGFEIMQDIIWELAKEKNFTSDHVLFPEHGVDPQNYFDYYDAQDDYLCFGLDFVKWYDGYYNDVDLFMEMLKVADKHGVAWQFIRTGEEYGDVENMYSDNFDDGDLPFMGVSMEICY